MELINFFKGYKKGTYIRFEWFTLPSNTRAAYKGRVKKITKAVVRLGIDYSHIKENENKVIGGLVGQQHHLSGFENYIIVNEKTNEEKLRVYLSKNHKHKMVSTYYLDGNETTFDNLVEIGALPPKKDNREQILCFDIKVNNILKIGA